MANKKTGGNQRTLKYMGTDIVNTAKSAVKQQGDSGTATIRVGINAIDYTKKVYRAAAKASPTVIKLGQKTYKVARSVDRAYSKAKLMGVPAPSYIRYAVVHKIKSNPTVQTAVAVYKGNIPLREIAKHSGIKVAKSTGRALKFSGKGAVRSLKYGVGSGVNYLASSDDFGAQIAGHTVKGAVNTARGIRFTYHATKQAAKSSYKVGKTGYKAAQSASKVVGSAKTFGVRATAKKYGAKGAQAASRAITKAGGSAVSAMLNVIKKLGVKLLVPVALIVGGLMMFMNIIQAPAASVGGLFSGNYQDTNGKSRDVRTYLNNSVHPKIDNFVKEILSVRDQQYSNGIDYVYLEVPNKLVDISTISTDEIKRSIINNINVVDTLQPVFSSVILSKYGNQVSQEQLSQILDDLFNGLFTYKVINMPDIIAVIPLEPDEYYTDENGELITTKEDIKKSVKIAVKRGTTQDLLKNVFLNEINALERKKNKTQAEIYKLQNLKDGYELCLLLLDNADILQ